MTIRQENKSIYWTWKAMKQRCQNPRCAAFSNYGARGITVCNEWQTFEPFFEWCINNDYEKGLELDRIDNNSGYSPTNCRWVTRKTNDNNTRLTKYYTYSGETKTNMEWCEIYNLPSHILPSWERLYGREYAEKRLKDIAINGYKEKDYAYSHRKLIKHIETNTIFESVRKAAIYFHIAPCTISNAIRNNRKTKVGTFTYNI